MFKLSRTLCQSLLIVVLAATAAIAQTNDGTVSGTVTDPTGAAVPNATVTIHNIANGTDQTEKTTAEGYYRLAQVLPGYYNLTVSAPGFKQEQRTGIQVLVGNTASNNVTLAIGSSNETVTVSGQTLTLQTESSDVSTVVEPRLVQDLPVSVSSLRTPIDFVFLTPGVTGGGPVGNNSVKFAGGQDLGGLILIDGLPFNTSTGNNFDAPLNTPSVDAIQEFNVILAGMPAEYGRTSGGIESFVTKSGTNHYHGSIYEYFRNNALDANTWFNNYHRPKTCFGAGDTAACRAPFAVPFDKKNDYGVTMGGPIRIPKVYDGRDKTFAFFSFEQLRVNNGGTATVSVPTAANRAGDFSAQLGGPATTLGPNGQIVAVINPCTGQQIINGQIFNPATTRTVGNVQCRDPFPGNVITTPLSKVAQKVLSYIPPPVNNLANSNYFSRFSNPTLQTAETIRVDQNFNATNKVFASYNVNDNGNVCSYQTFPTAADPTCGISDNVWHAVRVGYDHFFTPNLLNHFTFGGDRENHHVLSAAAAAGGNYNADLGLSGTSGPTFPQFNFGGTSGAPGAYQSPGFGLDLALVDNHAYGLDSLEWTKGKHNLKFGVEYRYLQFSAPNTGGESGTYNFSVNETAASSSTQAYSGNPFASFLLGDVASASVQYQLHAPRSSQFYYAAFLQDDYKLRKNLTLNLGVRYDVEPAPQEKNQDKANLSLTLPNAAADGRPGALYFAGNGPGRAGVSSAFAHTWYKDVAPRVGFSYAPDIWNNTAVIRGSYDILYSALPISADIGTPAPGVNPVSPVSTGFNVNANYSDSSTNFNAPFNLSSGFPAYTLAPNLDPTQANGTPNAVYVAPSYGRPGMVQLWELEIQQQLPAGFITTIGYLGQHSTHSASNLKFINNLNPSNFALGTQLTALAGTAGAPVGNPYPAFQSNYGGNGNVAQALRPFPQFLEISQVLENVGQSTYNGGFVKVQRNFKSGFSFLSSYTWSKILTDADSQFPGVGAGGNPIQNPFNLRQERSYSTQDIPQYFTMAYVYELPFGQNKMFLSRGRLVNTFVGGWQVGGIHRYLSGFPVQFSCASPIPGTDTCTRYNLVGNPNLHPSGHYDPQAAADAVYNRAALQDPNVNVAAAGHYSYGNLPRVLGSVRTPVFLDEAFSLVKRTKLTEGTNLEFRADAFNAFNRHVFSGGDTTVTDLPTNGVGGFGTVGGVANTQRQLQLELRINY